MPVQPLVFNSLMVSEKEGFEPYARSPLLYCISNIFFRQCHECATNFKIGKSERNTLLIRRL